MKTKYLLPNKFKPLGWTLIISGVLVLLYGSFISPVNFGMAIPMPYNFGGFTSENDWLAQSDGNLHMDADELLFMILSAGLLITGFSRMKVEDERIAQIRLESLQWGIYANYLVLTICVLLVYGTAFFTVMMYSMFTPLIIFLLRFYFLVYVKPAIDIKNDSLI